MSAAAEQTDLVVAGAGPAGMLTALAAAERGLRVRVFDQYRRTALRSYALALHPATLRLLDRYGLAEDLVSRGSRIEAIDVFVGAEHSATLDVSAVGGPYPFVLVLPQALLESALERRLNDAAVGIEWGHAVMSWDRDESGVTVLVATIPEAEDPAEVPTRRVRASFLAGADGQGSLVRKLLRAAFEPAGPPLTYGLIEFERPIDEPGRSKLLFGAGTTDVFWPLGSDRARWGVQIADGTAEVAPPELWATVRERAPWFAADACRTEWSTIVSFQPGLSRSFGHDRVWLVGDAAHCTSPVSVQSMNTGLREGHDLARRMAAVLRGERPPKLLLYYHEEREREWRMLLGFHDRLRVSSRAPAWARHLGARWVSALPATGTDLNALLGQVGLRLRWLRGRRHWIAPGF